MKASLLAFLIIAACASSTVEIATGSLKWGWATLTVLLALRAAIISAIEDSRQ